jgi:hypothetical protein
MFQLAQCKLFKDLDPVIIIDYNTYQSRLSRCMSYLLSPNLSNASACFYHDCNEYPFH